MKIPTGRILVPASAVLCGVALAISAAAYPPGVGILSKNRSCSACHVSNGPWADDARTIVDVLDAKAKTSLRQADGTFAIEVPRYESRTVLTVIGRAAGEKNPPRRPREQACSSIVGSSALTASVMVHR